MGVVHELQQGAAHPAAFRGARLFRQHGGVRDVAVADRAAVLQRERTMTDQPRPMAFPARHIIFVSPAASHVGGQEIAMQRFRKIAHELFEEDRRRFAEHFRDADVTVQAEGVQREQDEHGFAKWVAVAEIVVVPRRPATGPR